VFRLHSDERRRHVHWNRARLSIVMPIGLAVAVAIVCIVVAVLTSARRADEVALDNDKQLFTNAIAHRGEWAMRKLASVVLAEQDAGGVALRTDLDWVRRRLATWLRTLMDHDLILVADGTDSLVYSIVGRSSGATQTPDRVPDLSPTLSFLRHPASGVPERAARLAEASTLNEQWRQTALLQQVHGRPAVTTGLVLGSTDATPDNAAGGAPPIVLTLQFVDDEFLADISKRLNLNNLREVGTQPVSSSDFAHDFLDSSGHTIARFAWTPTRPGSAILASVVPFVIVALAGFTLLAGLVFRYMRTTAATIAAGETRMRHLALHDPLSGLPNRIFFGERLEAVIDSVRRGGPQAGVFYIDLDHFKDVNDTLGHPIGDELIRNVTARLSRTLRGDDLVARLGGDEFAVITTAATDAADLQAIATRIICGVSAPYSINGHNIVIGSSIGIAVIDKRTGGAADIMRYADMALYRAKNEGRNRACVYDAAMDADLLQRKLLEADLRHAIENDGLHVLYQPIVNNSGEKMVGVEALARWTHPTRGEMPPAEFIPIAEHSGLIIELGEWVLRRACLDGKDWPGLTVAVNVSPLQFRRLNFVEMVERILADTEFDPARLELEVTESTLLGNVETAQAAMLRLKALGVRLALDDFGTGYSSLLYLRKFPFDKLKIDRSFVRSIEKAPDAAAIVHAVVSLGRGLGMKVTAEGVETPEQHLFLRAAGVHTMQGYRFGRPSSAADISARLAAPSGRSIDMAAIAAMAS
jgi:diguanylate cyclase (GGDEF)-like protein